MTDIQSAAAQAREAHDKTVRRWMSMIEAAYLCRDDIRDSSGNTPRSYELQLVADEMRAALAAAPAPRPSDLRRLGYEGVKAPYNAAQIAWELERTALGDGHYGNALRVAKDIPGLTDDDRALLDRYATGSNGGTDHVALQDLALRIDRHTLTLPLPASEKGRMK